MINRLYPDFTDLPGRRDLPRSFKRVSIFAEHIDVSIITPYYTRKPSLLKHLYRYKHNHYKTGNG